MEFKTTAMQHITMLFFWALSHAAVAVIAIEPHKVIEL